ncbi:hypothetical protein LZ31DRAFT_100744 [Colletotrichum somersetense]|nr:hypothetical protein LZ31DRAFT_100744 [Colletotrichum somersetense]
MRASPAFPVAATPPPQLSLGHTPRHPTVSHTSSFSASSSSVVYLLDFLLACCSVVSPSVRQRLCLKFDLVPLACFAALDLKLTPGTSRLLSLPSTPLTPSDISAHPMSTVL